MIRQYLIKFLTIMFVLACGTAQAIVPVHDDIWDISRGAVVDSFSGIVAVSDSYKSDARNMFGGSYGQVEYGFGNTVFADNQPAGYTHFIEWHTPGMINLTGFHLFAVYDYESPSYARSFQEFRLYYKNGLDWMIFYTLDSIPPYGVDTQENELAKAVNHLSITAEYFRAEFDQYGEEYWASGPRISELDGFGSYLQPVPEPVTLLLLGTGLLGLWGLRRKRS